MRGERRSHSQTCPHPWGVVSLGRVLVSIILQASARSNACAKGWDEMETPYWMCFECDHKQVVSDPCEECGSSCHEVGDEKAGKYWSAVEFVKLCKEGEGE